MIVITGLSFCSRSQTDAHLGGGPVPASAAQRRQADPVATAGLNSCALSIAFCCWSCIFFGLRQIHWDRRRVAHRPVDGNESSYR